jgi:hypothetical protein
MDPSSGPEFTQNQPAATSPRRPGIPRWVKVSALVGIGLLLLLIAVALLGGGEAGPGQHGPGQHTAGAPSSGPLPPSALLRAVTP